MLFKKASKLDVKNLGVLNPDDTIILIMGVSGTGKSTFINWATDPKQSTTVGHGLKPHTANIHAIKVKHPTTHRPYVLIDTPGFDNWDNEQKSEAQVLDMVSECLAKENVKLSGILYLHRITDNRQLETQTPLQHLTVLENLCGENPIKQVALATTFWSDNEEKKDVMLRREQYLKERYWKRMQEAGSGITRFIYSHKSAWDIIDGLSPERYDAGNPTTS